MPQSLSSANLTDGFAVKVAGYRGYALVVLTRDEHCPPHVHVGDADWEARFKFGFWHDTVCLWDVIPTQNAPRTSLLEQLRQTLMKPGNLRRAREAWWLSRQTVCLDNLRWQPGTQEVVRAEKAKRGARKIFSATFDTTGYRTVLQLEGEVQVEIEL